MSGFHGIPSAKVGQIIELAYLPDPMWPGFAVADHSIQSKTDPKYKRLARAIGQVWRMDADVFDTATHFRLPDGTRLRKGATVTPAAAPVSAAYPLDDDGTVAASLGELWLPMIAPDYQSFTYESGTEVIGGITLIAARDAATTLDFAQCKALTAGRVTAVQLNITSCAATYDQWVSLILYKLDNTNTVAGSARVGTKGTTGALVGMRQLNSGAYEDLGAVTGPRDGSIAMYVNGDDGAVGWTVNGVDQGYIAGFSVAAGERFGFLVCIDDLIGNSGTVTGEFITQASAITEPIPGTGEDIAGNLIGVEPVATSNVGQRGGSATTGGHALTIDEMPAHTHGDGGGGAKLADYGSQDITVGDGNTGPTGSTGGGEAHTHTLDPEHACWIVLVKL